MSDKSTGSVQAALVSMLRRCADYVASLPANEVDAFVRGDVELQISLRTKQRKGSPKNAKSGGDTKVVEEAVSQMAKLNSREEGEQLLRSVASTKSVLEKIARRIDIGVRKGESAEDLMRRIVQSTIGYRLASAAIHGKNSHRDRDHGSRGSQTEGDSKQD